MRSLTAVLAAVLLALVATAPAAAAAPAPLTILVSIDGFRPDYLDRGVTPTLSKLAAEGVRGAMRPSFPSKTFPNHYTLVTGLRPDRNGVVDNTMQDPAIPGVTFRMSNAAAVSDRRWWDEAEPIWVTAQKAGLTTATMFWPGSEAAIHGVRPAYWQHFDQSRTSAQRVGQVLAWLDLPPDARPRFVALYFDAVDTAGHLYGPDSPQVDAALASVDSALGALTHGLSARSLAANLVIVSDHGMAAVSAARRIYLDDLVPMADLKAMTMGAFLAASPTPGHAAEAETALLRPHPHMQCWRKGQIPARYHYGRNPRVPAIVCLPQTGWEITTHGYKGRQAGGDHGFDPYDPLMAAIFIADGPAFRHGVVLPAFDNVDVYPLVARVIGVTPQPNDGHLAEVAAALAP